MRKKVSITDILDQDNPPKTMKEFERRLTEAMTEVDKDDMLLLMACLLAAKVGYGYGKREG